MSYTAQEIQSMIDSNKGLIFTYNYSKPGVMRFVHPMSIVDNNVVVRESNTDKIKKFKLTGIQLFKNNQPIVDTECEAYKLKELESQINHDIPVPNTPRNMSTQFTVSQTVQSMIDCNCPMVFYYTHSRPELKRIAHPILIVGNHVVCVESDTGKHKRFKLDGIEFPPEEDEPLAESDVLNMADENSQEIQDLGEELTNVENTVREHIKDKTEFSFTYSFRLPWENEDVVNEVKTVVPIDIKNGMMLGRVGLTSSWYILEHIRPHVGCEGCLYELGNQQGHMGPGGCLSEERPSNKGPKIVSKRHAWDCGCGWDYDEDCCDCGERGWTHVWYDDGRKEVLNNM